MRGRSGATLFLSPRVPELIEERFGTLSAFADATGLSRNTVYTWFRGEPEASPRCIAAMSGFLDLPMEDVVVTRVLVPGGSRPAGADDFKVEGVAA